MRTFWTEEENNIMKVMYADTPSGFIAEKLNKSVRAVYQQAGKLGLKKSKEFLQSADCGRLYKDCGKGIDTRFKKGQPSFNKGKKQLEFMTAAAIEKSKATRFKKGRLPHNTKPEGTILFHLDKRTGNKYGYVRDRATGKLNFVHRINYEKSFGEIPEGGVVIFKDGDTLNTDPSNLQLITYAENMKRNTIHRYPQEVKEAIRLISKLTKKINQHEKQN